VPTVVAAWLSLLGLEASGAATLSFD